LNWAIKEGQAMAEPLSYAPLPQSVLPKVQQKIDSIVLQ